MFYRISKYAGKNILRNKFLSFSSILVLTLLMFFINILLVVQHVSFKLMDAINEKLTISLYLNDKYNKNSLEVVTLMNDISSLIPGKGGIVVYYKSKEKALEDMRTQDPDLVKIIERMNPLPNTIELSGIPIAYWEKVNLLVQGQSGIFSAEEVKEGEEKKDDFSEYSSQFNNVTKVTDYLDILRASLVMMIGMFLFSIGIIIYSIVGNFVYYYRDEIYITRLVGGSKIFIYGPFILQGAFYATVSFLLGFSLFYGGLQATNYLLESSYGIAFVLGQYEKIALIELSVFIMIGGLSGFVSSHKYLKAK